jgi:signal transduction histidine kinase
LIEFFASLSERVSRAEGGGNEKTSVRSLLSELGDAVLVIDRKGRVLAANEDAGRLLGAKGGAIAGARFEELLPGSHPLRSLLAEAAASRSPMAPRTVDLPAQDGAAPQRVEIRELAGETAGFLLVVHDAQRATRLGSQLTHSRRLAALGRLTSGVAHEIRNPLNALVLQAAVLKFKLDERDEEVRRHVAILEKEVKNLDRIIDGFLKFMRPEEAPLEPISLAAPVRETVELMRAKAEHARVRVEASVPEDLPQIAGSVDLLRQVFVNLFTNSIDAMPEGGTLRVSAAAASAGGVVVRVEDTGVGIPPERLPKVFDLFHTSKERGNGIGLSLVYRIVQHHGGEVSIDSEPGAGTRVVLSFPDARTD